MSALTESKNLGDLLKFEAASLYSRDRVTVSSGQDLTLGTVVSVVTASGKAKILAPAASDGSQTPVGVLIQDCDASSADNANGLIVARHAIVNSTGLVWPAGITDPQKAAATATLKSLGILIRTGA